MYGVCNAINVIINPSNRAIYSIYHQYVCSHIILARDYLGINQIYIINKLYKRIYSPQYKTLHNYILPAV